MRKALSYLLPLLVAFFALCPPIDFRVPSPTEHWPFLITAAGFLGIRILFMRVNPIVKVVPLIALIICFFGSIQVVCFNAYVQIVFCAYLYIGLTRMHSWRPMFATLKALLVFNALLLFMQYMGSDMMLNFGLAYEITCYGVVGQHMQMGSFSLVLASALAIISPWFLVFPIITALICNSSWTIACVGSGALAYAAARRKWLPVVMGILLVVGFVYMAHATGKIPANTGGNGRLEVWRRTVHLLNDRPWNGWGPGSFKGVFPALSDMTGIPWKTAHNDWLQFAFELGYPAFSYLVMAWMFLFYKLVKNCQRSGAPILIAAFVMISLDMIVHFPTRMEQCNPLILTLLAYIQLWLQKTSIEI